MISYIIGHWPKTSELDELLNRCVRALPLTYGETLIVVNDGIGVAQALNRGARLARGDFLAFVDNGTAWANPKIPIREACDKDAVTSAMINGVAQPEGRVWGPFIIVPRWIWETIGEFDEQFEGGHYVDDDFILRCRKANVRMYTPPGVEVTHVPATSSRFVPAETIASNREKFFRKWGKYQAGADPLHPFPADWPWPEAG